MGWLSSAQHYPRHNWWWGTEQPRKEGGLVLLSVEPFQVRLGGGEVS